MKHDIFDSKSKNDEKKNYQKLISKIFIRLHEKMIFKTHFLSSKFDENFDTNIFIDDSSSNSNQRIKKLLSQKKNDEIIF